MSGPADLARALAVDLIDSAGNVRESVAKLAAAGKRAAIGARMAGQMTRVMFEDMIDRAADAIDGGTRGGARGKR